jgi:uncharacterized protein (DUF305 family)
MKTALFWLAGIALAASTGWACRSAQPDVRPETSPQPPQLIQPGAPGQEGRVLTPAEASDLSHVQHTEADIKFMQGMIGHHLQAIEMVRLLETRTENEDLRKLALRIQVSQEDEIQMMREWLERRGAEVPGISSPV